MRRIRYSKYEGPADEVELEDLVRALQEHLLESGYSNNPWDPDPDAGRDFEDLLVAIAAALASGELVPDELIQEAMEADNWLESRLGQLAARLANRLRSEERRVGKEGRS